MRPVSMSPPFLPPASSRTKPPPAEKPVTSEPNRARWRWLVTPAATGAENMALDEALMARARTAGEWVLRVYSWSTPTISLGRNQTARGRYHLDRIASLGLSVVRRPTGGRAILHHREITYSVTAPVDGAGDLRGSYERINGLLVAGLDAMGIGATIQGADHGARPPGPLPCFAEPSAGELVLDGRKLAGSAQWRSDGALLQHGSILVADDQSTLQQLTLGGQPALPAPATLTDALGRAPDVYDLANHLVDAVRSREDPDAGELPIDDALRAHAEALVVRYLDDAWTWRR